LQHLLLSPPGAAVVPPKGVVEVTEWLHPLQKLSVLPVQRSRVSAS